MFLGKGAFYLQLVARCEGGQANQECTRWDDTSQDVVRTGNNDDHVTKKKKGLKRGWGGEKGRGKKEAKRRKKKGNGEGERKKERRKKGGREKKESGRRRVGPGGQAPKHSRAATCPVHSYQVLTAVRVKFSNFYVPAHNTDAPTRQTKHQKPRGPKFPRPRHTPQQCYGANATLIKG